MVEIERVNNIYRILFDRAEKKNAITLDMYQQLADGINSAAEDSSVKIIVLGSLNENFTAGNDLADFLANPSLDEGSPTYQFLKALVNCPLPIIAAVEGFAIGIGSTLLLHCERVFSGSTATFAFPFINLGLVPEAGSSLLLPRLVGYQQAADWLLTGEAFTVQQALKAGFVSEVVEQGLALQQAMQYATKLSQKPRETLIEVKQLLRRDEENLNERVDAELQQFMSCLSSPAAIEAMSAFMEKRKPNFENL